MNENELISAFADLCGIRDLDPVAVLNVLNAQDWSQDEEQRVTVPASVTVYVEPVGSATVMTPSN
jgi:hypothetical protein